MAAAVSQLCVRQGSTLLDCFNQHKGCKVEQISPLFHLCLYLFFKFRRASYVNVNLADIYTEYGSRLMAKEEKSTFQISSLLLSSFISNIYTRERLLLAKSAKQSEGEGVSRSQLQCQATTALRKNSIESESSKSTSVNVREGNFASFDDKARVTWILVRKSTEPQRG